MSNDKHTPGPWTLETVPTQVGACHKIGLFPSHGVRDSTYACVYVDGGDPIQPRGSIEKELYANACLIAAAPEMLEALRDIVEQYETTGQMVPADLADSIRVFGKAAIAKAEGRHA